MNRAAGTSIVCRWTSWIVAAERLASAGLLAVILVSMGAQVVARYVFRSPISWSEEAACFAFVWLAFLAAAFVMAESRHIVVDIFSSRLNSRGKLLVECVSSGLIVAACLLLLGGGFRFVWRVGLVASPALGIPKSCWYGAASVGAALMALHAACNVAAALQSGGPVWDEAEPDDELGSSGRGNTP